MQALLSFRFPHYQKEVLVQVFVPLPEQRPYAVANFIFAITGQLPPPDMMSALRLDAASAMPIAVSDATAARAGGLVPFADTAVVRVEKGSLVEMGSSTTKTIFGGFLPDEPVHLPSGPAHGSLASTMLRRPAGTILCGNMGMPNTQASRYYILLKAAADTARTADQREELQGYPPLGMVTSGLDALIAASEATQVNPRTLAPTKKVELVGCHLEFDYRGLARKLRETAFRREDGQADQAAVAAAAAADRKRIAGRTRARDEDDDQVNVDPSAQSEETGADGSSGGSGGGGFFQFNVHYPERSLRAGPVSGNAKRRRAEAVTVGEDGQPVLRTTAVHTENGVPVASGEANFDFFGAQDAAFWNDIDLIKDQQTQRQHQQKHRAGKSFASGKAAKQRKAFASGASSSSSRKSASASAASSVLGKVGSQKGKRPAGKRY